MHKQKSATYLVPLRTSYIHIHLNGLDAIQTDSMGNRNLKLPKWMAVCCRLTLTHTCGLFPAPSNKGKHRHTEIATCILNLLRASWSEKGPREDSTKFLHSRHLGRGVVTNCYHTFPVF